MINRISSNLQKNVYFVYINICKYTSIYYVKNFYLGCDNNLTALKIIQRSISEILKHSIKRFDEISEKDNNQNWFQICNF